MSSVTWEDYTGEEEETDIEDYYEDKTYCESCGAQIHGKSYYLDDIEVCEQCYEREVNRE